MTDQSDFDLFLKENSLTREECQYGLARSQVDWSAIESLFIATSPIAGYGMFAGKKINAGERFAPAKKDETWTLAGRYTNHSQHPNAMAVKDGNEVWIVAARDIPYGEEVTADYRQVKSAMESRQ